MLFPVEFDRRNVPLLTKEPDHFARKRAMEACCLIPLGRERGSNLGIHQPCCIEFTDALLNRFYIGRGVVAAHTAFVAKLLIRPSLPVDLHPDLPMCPFAVDDHVADDQPQHLLAFCTGGRGSLEDAQEDHCPVPQWLLDPPG